MGVRERRSTEFHSGNRRSRAHRGFEKLLAITPRAFGTEAAKTVHVSDVPLIRKRNSSRLRATYREFHRLNRAAQVLVAGGSAKGFQRLQGD